MVGGKKIFFYFPAVTKKIMNYQFSLLVFLCLLPKNPIMAMSLEEHYLFHALCSLLVRIIRDPRC